MVGARRKFAAAVEIDVKGELADRGSEFALKFVLVIAVDEAIVRREILFHSVVDALEDRGGTVPLTVRHFAGELGPRRRDLQFHFRGPTSVIFFLRDDQIFFGRFFHRGLREAFDARSQSRDYVHRAGWHRLLESVQDGRDISDGSGIGLKSFESRARCVACRRKIGEGFRGNRWLGGRARLD
jgi:hypothetical protein